MVFLSFLTTELSFFFFLFQTNLQVDWNNSPENYTCYETMIEPSYSIRPKIYCEYIPKFYYDAHICMNETIEYNDIIPT